MLRSIDRRTWAIWLAGLMVLALAGCTGMGPGASGSPGPQPSTCTPAATAAPSRPPTGGCGGEPYTAAELRLVLIDDLGPLWYCDRDEYPVGRDELEGMRASWPDLVKDVDLAAAIRDRLGLPAFDDVGWTDDDRLSVYRLWKMATAIQLEDLGNGRFRFDYLAQPPAGGAEGTRTAGLIDTQGAMTIEQRAPAGEPMCPICLSIGTLIDGPDGAIPADRLRIGDPVWTLDVDGRRIPGVVIALGSTPAPPDHRVVRVTLADGRSVTASPGHPLADGRTVADLAIGDVIDRSAVVSLDPRSYEGSATFDLVVSGPTGTYLAGGIPLGSTLD
jgi:hypothetical protein